MDTNSNQEKHSLEELISSVVDTFKFQGVTLCGMDITTADSHPVFTVQVSKSKRSKSLDDVLNFVYWTLWVLLYGEYSEEKSKEYKIDVDYMEVE